MLAVLDNRHRESLYHPEDPARSMYTSADSSNASLVVHQALGFIVVLNAGNNLPDHSYDATIYITHSL